MNNHMQSRPHGWPVESSIAIDFPAGKAEEYMKTMFSGMMFQGMGEFLIPATLQNLLSDKDFAAWTNLTREEREGLPPEAEAIMKELDAKFAVVRWVFDTLMPMVFSPEMFEQQLELLRLQGFNVHNEPREGNSKYYVGLRGDFGWLHIYNGN